MCYDMLLDILEEADKKQDTQGGQSSRQPNSFWRLKLNQVNEWTVKL